MLFNSRRLRVGLQFLFSVLVLWWLIHKLGARDLVSRFANIRPGLILGCLAAYLIAQLLSAWRWATIGGIFGFPAVSAGYLGRATSLYFLGMFYNLFLPTGYGGDVIKALYQANDRTPPSKTLAAMTILLDRFCGMLAVLLLGGLSSWGLKSQLGVYGAVMAWGFAVCVGLAPAALMLARRMRFLPRKFRFIALVLCAKGHLFWGVGVLSIVIQLINVGIYWALFAGLGATLGLTQITFAYALVTLATLLPVSIGGLGVRESGWAALMLPFGAAPQVGVSAGLLYFFIQSVASLFGVVPFFREGKAKCSS